MSQSAQSTLPASPADAPTVEEPPTEPPADLLPNVPAARWEYIPPGPGSGGQWRVSTGEQDQVPLADTLRRAHTPERMTLAQAIQLSLRRARRAAKGEGPIYAGRPHPVLAERFQRQTQTLRVLRRRHQGRSTTVRRMPPARPAARRPAARRSLGARSSPDPGSEGDPERLAPSFERLRRLTPSASGARREELAHRFRFADAIWMEVGQAAEDELERYVRGELS